MTDSASGNDDAAAAHAALAAWAAAAAPLAVAVSGGVDSLTLATVIARSQVAVAAFHATSAAVPSDARQRVRAWAEQTGIALEIVDAGELADPHYVANPVDRCRFCKADLYATIAARTEAQIVSGTNTDDLGEWRPGLQSAAAANVRHPFVECGVDKATIRQLATRLGLGAVADLPASPCLASRVETGLPVRAPELLAIDSVEKAVAALVGPGNIRCRIRRDGIVVELDAGSASRLGTEQRRTVIDLARRHFGAAAPISFADYARGSAFVGLPTRGDREASGAGR